MLSQIDKLLKILKLETERGFDNRAVLGGLDKIIPVWENDARTENIPDRLIVEICSLIQSYQEHDFQDRAAIIEKLKTLLYEYQLPSDSMVKGNNEDEETHTHSTEIRKEDNNKSALLTSQNVNSEGNGMRSGELTGSIGLNSPLQVISGIGPKNSQLLKNLGLNTLGDLLYYFPRRYDDYSQLKPINQLVYKDETTVIATVQSCSVRNVHKGAVKQIVEVVVSDGTGFLRLNWFNNPYISNQLHPEDQIVISGKIDMYLGRLTMNSPDWEYLEKEHLHTNRIVPVYPLTARITQKTLRRTIYNTVNFWAARTKEYLPDQIRQTSNLIDLPKALQKIHFPDSLEQLIAAQTRLAFDEIFLLQLGILKQKRIWQSSSAKIYESTDDWIESVTRYLPFSLTNAQQKVLGDVRHDLTTGHPMNRLLQGDVGSGKTIIAAIAIAIVTKHQAQAAFMAPTSILAEQHYRNLLRLLASPEAYPLFQMNEEEICLLMGDTPEAEKRLIRENLENGKIKVIIGTHALIEDPIVFKNLQLIIVDEQHRFGVSQRANLRNKGSNPHLLVMTATPIPRSLALTVYGDLDLSVLDEMPPGRLPVETHIIHPLERERAYEFISSHVESGHQAFIIYPLVEKGERDEAKAAVEEHTRLQKEVFAHFKIGLLHGRMKPDEKDHAMANFRDGDYQILVSTSVIEVGIDIPNATVILIEGANRFGLSQLHQFRGRVGRGNEKSYCLLIPENEDALENERLSVMTATNDGFVLAEKDLQQRGPGEFLGTRQSGFNELKMASITDIKLIEKARNAAQNLYTQDPELSTLNRDSVQIMMRRFWGENGGDLS